MASKKYLFLTSLLSLLAVSEVFGQSTVSSSTAPGFLKQHQADMTYRGGSYDYLDTAFIPQSRQAQQNSFLNHQSIYPAKPRDMMTLGINAGILNYFTGIPAQLGWGIGANLRKSLGYTFSLRGSLLFGQAKGLDYRDGTPVNTLPASVAAAYTGSGLNDYVANYKSSVFSGSLDVLASLNNIMFHKAQTKVDFYVLGGYSFFSYLTTINALDASGNPYTYAGINFGGSRSSIRSALKSYMDNSYETNSQSQARQQNFSKNGNQRQFRHSVDLGGGVDFRLSQRISLALEQKFTFPFDQYIDGRYTIGSDAVQSIKSVSYTSVGINIALGDPTKQVTSLWWLNPLDYAYSELNSPRHMKIPTPVLPDADGDGVTDQFDLDPNTPPGVAVDTHGRPLDTDGDGVPDYKDKQLITPTYCQPVDADGVGKCPCPDSSCFTGYIKAGTCNLTSLPSIMFKGRNVKIADDQEAMLDMVANQMRQSPDCKVVVTGHAQASKTSEQLAWDRVNSVITYMTEKEGISGDRFIFQYSGVPGDINAVDLRAATAADSGPNMTPPPHPNLRRSK